ncbi:hypothetical protein GCM10029992_66510 [Glycomyces albus]
MVDQAERVQHGEAAQVQRDAVAVGEHADGLEPGRRGHVGVAAGDDAGHAAGGDQFDGSEVGRYSGLVLVGGVSLAEGQEEFVPG